MAENKKRVKIPKENKVRAELQKEIGSVCPFCENSEVGHFEIHHIDEDPSNNNPINLILLCPTCHSKITKGDISQNDVFKKKLEVLSTSVKLKSVGQKQVNFNGKVNTAIIGNNNTFSIKQGKTPKPKYPEGCIGFDSNKANYISYLIGRYNTYKEYEVGKYNMKYALFSSQLKRLYKLGPTRTINNLPINRFEELVSYIQSRIDATKLAKLKGKGHKNYSNFEEYIVASNC